LEKRLVVLCAAAALTVLGGCGGDSDQPETTSGTGGGSTVVIRDIQFKPARITVEEGDTVTWRFQDGGIAHNVVADDESFKSETKDSGVFEHRFGEPGSVPYKCTIHPGMEGAVRVR
jgi:plastocyanin